MTTRFESIGELLGETKPWIAALAHNIPVGVLAGFAAGVVAGGLGSRLAMRVTGLAAGSDMQGVLTEARSPVGEITAGGTFFLIFFGGFIGIIGGLIYAGVRPWVAGAGRWRGVTYGVFLLTVGSWSIIEGDTPDFHRFGPPLLNIAMFASLFILFGVIVASLFDWIARWLPAPSFRRGFGPLMLPASYSLPSLVSLAAHGFGLLIAVQMGMAVIDGFGEEGNTREYLRIFSIYLLLIPAISAALLARHVDGFRRLADLRRQPAALAVTLAVLAPPVVAGVTLNTLAIIQIFGGSD